MYNFALAFVLCAAVYIIGEVVSTATKAWIPSVFVTAAIILVGYWTVLPTTLISDAVLIPFGSTIGIYLLITHMGTVISIKQLLEQWKTIVVCLAGLAGMCVLALFVCPLLMDRSFVVAGLPPLTGGIASRKRLCLLSPCTASRGSRGIRLRRSASSWRAKSS